MTLVLDVSNYDWDTWDGLALKAEGVTGVILGCQREGIARIMADECVRVGIPLLGTYGFVYFAGDRYVGHEVTQACAVAHAYGLRRVWVDCELDANQAGWGAATTPDPEQRVDQIIRAVDTVRRAGLEPGIYTGWWWWPNRTGNSTLFADLPLWHSDYGINDGSRAPVKTVAYGGWIDVAIHQYTSTLQVAGRGRDANYVFEENDMASLTDDDVRRIIREELHALHITDKPVAPTVSGATLDSLDDFLTSAFKAAQTRKTIKGLKAALHPDGPQP